MDQSELYGQLRDGPKSRAGCVRMNNTMPLATVSRLCRRNDSAGGLRETKLDWQLQFAAVFELVRSVKVNTAKLSHFD